MLKQPIKPTSNHQRVMGGCWFFQTQLGIKQIVDE